MAAAVSALLNHEVQRIVLTRPAVEAGEALGFLPGDLREKILPYLRPLYDALHDMLEPEEVVKLTEKGIIEIAPLAYMRGRTLSRAFVILDEAQNTTPEQMMMFLTRLGEDSRMVVTGDVTQIDLPRSKQSGLLEVRHILKDTPGIVFHTFTAADVVRHPLVQRIIEAYERYKNPMAGPRLAGGLTHVRPQPAQAPRRRPRRAPGRPEASAPGLGFRDFLDRSRLVAGLIFVVTWPRSCS
jgi:phosphate starvation-inducible protein PhoH and related proteins